MTENQTTGSQRPEERLGDASYTTYSNGENLPHGVSVVYHATDNRWAAYQGGRLMTLGPTRLVVEGQVAQRTQRAQLPLPLQATATQPPAPTRRDMRKGKAGGALRATVALLAAFALGAGATALVAEPQVVTHTNFKEVPVEVQVPVTPEACERAIDQIMEFRVLATKMLTAAMAQDIDGMLAVSDDMDTLNLVMAAAQQQCLEQTETIS